MGQFSEMASDQRRIRDAQPLIECKVILRGQNPTCYLTGLVFSAGYECGDRGEQKESKVARQCDLEILVYIYIWLERVSPYLTLLTFTLLDSLLESFRGLLSLRIPY